MPMARLQNVFFIDGMHDACRHPYFSIDKNKIIRQNYNGMELVRVELNEPFSR